MESKELEVLAKKAEEALAKRKAELAAKYPHARVETLRFDPTAGNGGKYQVQITCTECGSTEHWLYTSDLFQRSTCDACAKAAKATKKAKKAAELKAAREFLAQKKAEVAQPVAQPQA